MVGRTTHPHNVPTGTDPTVDEVTQAPAIRRDAGA